MADDPPLNNPAGRLYSLFTQLRKVEDHVAIYQAWAQVLGVEPGDIRRHMSEVARLVWDLDRVLSIPGRERSAAAFHRYKPQLLEAAFPISQNLEAQVAGLKPSAEAYEALGLVADFLATAAPEGAIPSDEEQADMLEKLQTLIDEVTDDKELPDNIMRLVLERLRSVQEALENIRTGGPGAVQRATEALLGAAFASSVMNEKVKKSKSMGRVVAVVGSIWIVFTSGPTVQKSLEAWTGAYQDITSGSAQIQPASQPPARAQAAQAPAPQDEEKPPR